MQGDVFCGWVSKVDSHVIIPKLRAGKIVKGVIVEVQRFIWGSGGGDCISGLVGFNDVVVVDD